MISTGSKAHCYATLRGRILCLTEAKISGKREIRNLILNIWVNSSNDSSFADVTLTLPMSQVHCFDNMQLL